MKAGILRLALLFLLAIVLASLPGPAMAASEKTLTKVNAAIDSIRGNDPRTNSQSESEALDARLDKAWNVLTKHASAAKDAIRTVLADEQDDSFLLIDLSYLYLVLNDGDPASLELASKWLRRADPKVYPGGFFNAASIMGSKRCQSCLPAVLQLLELKELEASIPEHALYVDLDMGLLFSIGPYGATALAHLVEAFEHSDCVARQNAVSVASTLLDPAISTALIKVASRAECPEARFAAWIALGRIGEASLTQLVDKRLSAAGTVESKEKLAMISGLEQLYWPPETTALERLARDQNPEVAAAANKAIEGFDDAEGAAGLLSNAGSGSSEGRADAIKRLERAVETGKLEFSGTAFDLEAMLTPGDLALVNDARASVLRRHSDECLYEWKKLFLVGQLFLQISRRAHLPATR